MGIKTRIKAKLFGVTYDQDFFSSGWFTGWEELKHCLAQLIDSLEPGPKVLDFGCGPGVMIDLMAERGYEYFGADYLPEPRKLYLQHFGKYPERYLSEIPPSPDFGLFLAFDVFEHLKDAEVAQLVEKTEGIPLLMLNISRQKGIPGHINLKSDDQWIIFLQAQGLSYLKERTQALRALYLALRPGGPDLWHKNLFLFAGKSR